MNTIANSPNRQRIPKATAPTQPKFTAAQFKKEISEELKNADLKPPAVFKLMPDDWREIAQTAGGQYELRSLIAQNLGLGLDAKHRLVAKDFLNARFRAAKNIDRGKMRSAANCAATIARQVLRAMPQPPPTNHPLVPEATELRQYLLQSGRPWIDLELLVDYCWRIHIPVLYLPELPATGKMTGMVVRQGKKFAIVLSKKATNDIGSYLLFTLGHELGHIAHDHLREESGFLAEIGQDEIDQQKSSDQQEQQADRYARDLLLGRDFILPSAVGSEQLSEKAVKIGKESKIDPGLILLNSAHNSREVTRKNYWPLINKTVSSLKLQAPPCQNLLSSKFYDNIDIDELKLETWELLTKLKILPPRSLNEI